MSLEEALRFWKSEFMKIMDGDKVFSHYYILTFFHQFVQNFSFIIA